MKEKAVCFTGHRKLIASETTEIAQRLKDTVVELIIEGYSYFYAGGALGFDTLAAQTVLELRKDFPQIKLILALPHPSQSSTWSDKERVIYDNIKNHADKVIYTSPENKRGCMHIRNRYLVEHSCVCVCYLTVDSGGTFYTVNYAEKNGLRLINIAKSGEE